MIRPYLSNIINNHKTQGEWKVQLIMASNFMSSKDSDETHIMHTKSNNIKIMIGNGTDEINRGLFESLLQKYQKGLEESTRGSEFVFDSIDILCYKLHKISLNRGGSYIDSPQWLRKKRNNKSKN